MTKKRLMVVLGAAISLIFLYLSLRGQNWAEIGLAFGQADYRWLIPAGVLILADYGFRAWRWRIILEPPARQRLPLKTLFPVLILGFAANNILPARAGELWRMWGLAQRTSVRKTVALSTMVVERLFDGFTLLFLLALAGTLHPLTGQVSYLETIAFVLFGLVAVGLVMFLVWEDFTLKVASWVMWPMPENLRHRLLEVIGRFAEGLHALRRPSSLIAIVITSLLAWGSQALSFGAILMAFNLFTTPAELLSVAILMLACINLIIMIPAGPGNVGTFEGAGLLALSVAGLNNTSEVALAIVLVTHMLQWILVTGLGLIIAAQEGLTLAGLSAGPQEAGAEG